jgi:HAD superfamily hydrolase (TIGR01549 family)
VGWLPTPLLTAKIRKPASAAIIFDLDETLLDTSMLRGDRTHRRWRQLAARLDEVEAYLDEKSTVQAADLPAQVKGVGFQVGVITHSPRWYAERLLSAFGIPHDALITGSDGYAPKPDPSSLRAIADELGVPVEDCIMVGDDAVDIGAAQNAGCIGIGVAWSRRAPKSWRRRWPNIAIATPDRLIDVLNNSGPRFPFAEAVLAGDQPLWHWGSLLRLGNGIYGAGHYYTVSDSRHPGDVLSRLIIEAKNDPKAAERVGELLARLASTRWQSMDVDLITSVPPKPGQTYDRFALVRAAIATASDTVERGNVLRQLFDDDDYKHQPAADRPGRVSERFASTALSNERVLLIDDVITSGGQAEECRRQMLAQGAGRVVILALGVTQERLPRACPECGGFLRLITTGPRGDFIGCSNFYRGCLYTEEAPSA